MPLRVPVQASRCRFGDPGTLVLELDSCIPSTVVGGIDDRRMIVRHVGTADDHVVPLDSLRLFADGHRVRAGVDFGEPA